MKKLIIIDGSYFLYKFYYSNNLLINNKKKSISYYFINMIYKLLLKYNPSHIVVVFDSKGGDFNKKMIYPKYKFNRISMPLELSKQIKYLLYIFYSIGIYYIKIYGIEADDIIGTITNKFRNKGFIILINSIDKDMDQLVSENIYIINIKNNLLLTYKDIYNKYGFPPILSIDFLSIAGDLSDNIPGIYGIGKKTAKIILQNFSGLNKIYLNLDCLSKIQIKGSKKLKEKFLLNKYNLYLYYKLIKINKNIKIDLCSKNMIINKYLLNSLTNLLKLN